MIRRKPSPAQIFEQLCARPIQSGRRPLTLDLAAETPALVAYLAQAGRFQVQSVPRPRVFLTGKNPEPWRTVLPELLVGHIGRFHLSPAMLQARAPVAAYDIEVAHLRGIALDCVVEKMVAGVLRSDEEIQSYPHDPMSGFHIDPAKVRRGLIKNLHYVQMLGCFFRTHWGKIWERLERVVSGCHKHKVDLYTDCHEHLWSAREWGAKKNVQRFKVIQNIEL